MWKFFVASKLLHLVTSRDPPSKMLRFPEVEGAKIGSGMVKNLLKPAEIRIRTSSVWHQMLCYSCWVPRRLVSSTIGSFSTSMILGGRVGVWLLLSWILSCNLQSCPRSSAQKTRQFQAIDARVRTTGHQAVFRFVKIGGHVDVQILGKSHRGKGWFPNFDWPYWVLVVKYSGITRILGMFFWMSIILRLHVNENNRIVHERGTLEFSPDTGRKSESFTKTSGQKHGFISPQGDVYQPPSTGGWHYSNFGSNGVKRRWLDGWFLTPLKKLSRRKTTEDSWHSGSTNILVAGWKMDPKWRWILLKMGIFLLCLFTRGYVCEKSLISKALAFKFPKLDVHGVGDEPCFFP